MRLSGDTTSPDYNPVAQFAKVFLDGKEIKGCVTADEDTGEAICYKYVSYDDEPLRIDIDENGVAQMETLRGAVRIDVADSTLPAEFVGQEWFDRSEADRAAKGASHG